MKILICEINLELTANFGTWYRVECLLINEDAKPQPTGLARVDTQKTHS